MTVMVIMMMTDDDDNKYNDDDGTDLTLVQGTSWSHKAGDRIVFLSAQAEMLVDNYDSRDVMMS